MSVKPCGFSFLSRPTGGLGWSDLQPAELEGDCAAPAQVKAPAVEELLVCQTMAQTIHGTCFIHGTS